MTHLEALNIYYQNVRGLRTKSHDFISNVLRNNYDLISLTETWLTPDFYDGEYFHSNYNVYRRDRSGASGAARGVRGGGVLVAVRSDLSVRRRDDWCSSPAAEELWLTLQLDSSPPGRNDTGSSFLHIACAYFPHGPGHSRALQLFFDNVSERMLHNADCRFLLLGDFNISNASWILTDRTYPDFIPSDDSEVSALADFMNLSNLIQYNGCFNINGRILDLVLSNTICNVTAFETYV
ncbi:unnamed protein product [Colias eurytheme]|nr:unnamed protein product [Colias eurytheme]